MKMIPSILLVGVLAALNCGCSKTETPPPETSLKPDATATAPAAAAKVERAAQTNEDSKLAADLAKAAEAQKAIEAKAAADAKAKAEAEKAALDKAAADQAAAAKAAAAEADSKIQALIDAAKKLIAESKYADALKSITDLSQLKLSEAQQKVVDALKDQINKGMGDKATTEANKALGGLLPK
jgi:hypothetical protein